MTFSGDAIRVKIRAVMPTVKISCCKVTTVPRQKNFPSAKRQIFKTYPHDSQIKDKETLAKLLGLHAKVKIFGHQN